MFSFKGWKVISKKTGRSLVRKCRCCLRPRRLLKIPPGMRDLQVESWDQNLWFRNPAWSEELCFLFTTGKSTLTLVSFAPYEWFEEWKDEKVTNRSAEYKALKQKFIDGALEVILEVFPKITRDKVRGRYSHERPCYFVSTVSYKSCTILRLTAFLNVHHSSINP